MLARRIQAPLHLLIRRTHEAIPRPMHVDDLGKSIGFYSKLFAAEPTRVESDYAKWMLDDPRINFAISTRGSEVGIDHLGFQTDDAMNSPR